MPGTASGGHLDQGYRRNGSPARRVSDLNHERIQCRHRRKCDKSSLGLPYPERFSSGQTNSRTSLVGMLLTFSLLRAGIDSSRTHPRNGSSSLVRTCRKRGMEVGSWRWVVRSYHFTPFMLQVEPPVNDHFLNIRIFYIHSVSYSNIEYIQILVISHNFLKIKKKDLAHM